MALADTGTILGTGAGTEVVDEADSAVEDAAACIFFSDLVEYIAAVTPAPVAALTAAMMANVVLDIVKEGGAAPDGIYLVERRQLLELVTIETSTRVRLVVVLMVKSRGNLFL